MTKRIVRPPAAVEPVEAIEAAEDPTVEMPDDFVPAFNDEPIIVTAVNPVVSSDSVRYRARVQFSTMMGHITRSYKADQIIEQADVATLLAMGCAIEPIDPNEPNPYVHCPKCDHSFRLE